MSSRATIVPPSVEKAMLSRWVTEKVTDTEPTLLTRKMTIASVFPKEWTAEREKEAGIYPDIEDPEFSRKLYLKKEFYDARAEAFSSLTEKGDQCSLSAFEAFTLTPVQRAVSRFMHPSTPYLGLLLYHGVGVGKTCSAVSIAENFLADRPNQRVHIIVPRSIAPGFKKTIFNPALFRRAKADDPARYVKNGWYSAQCTSTTYLGLVGATPEDEESKIILRIENQKRRRYRISGYMAFKIAIDKLFKAIPSTITNPEELKERKRDILREHFNNGLIIIDEAHNLRQDPKSLSLSTDEIAPDENPDADAIEEGAEAKAIVPMLLEILMYCEGLRIVLMSATPMFNTAPEILFLLNLLILNDTKRINDFKTDELFDSKGLLKADGEALIKKMANRYVSYMRGENPFTFPIRLRPDEAIGFTPETYPFKTALRGGEDVSMSTEILDGISALPIIKVKPVPGSICEKMSRFQMNVSAQTTATINEDQIPVEQEILEAARRKNVLDTWTQIGNITYPTQTWGKDGWKDHFLEDGKNFTWKNPDYSVDDVFGRDALPQHAPKIAKIVDTIRTSKGINFVYSRYVQPGALPIAIALERAGYTRVNYDGEAIPLLKGAPFIPKQCALCPRKQHGTTPDCPVFKQANYVLLTSDYTTNLPLTITYATTFPNKESIRGGNVKVIIGSMIASEGLDLKCVREIHVLDPWYHLNRLEQIIGRGVRYCSHSLLPAEERNCLVHLYSLFYDDYETSDLYSYHIAVKKAKAIGLVQRQLKIGAWDCNLNYQGILLTGDIKQRHYDAQGKDLGEIMLADKANSSMCDYMECSYKCRLDVGPVSDDGRELDTSTFTVRDARSFMLLRESALRQMFSISPFWPLSQIREIYKGLPDDILSAALPLILNNASFQITFQGQTGYLILRNDYIIFQPDDVSDTSIPLALRYKRAADPTDGRPLWLTKIRPPRGIFSPMGSGVNRARPSNAGIGVVELEEADAELSKPVSLTSTATSTSLGLSRAPTQTKGREITLAEKPAAWVLIIRETLQNRNEPQALRLTPELKLRMKGLDDLGIIAHRFNSIPETKDVLLSFGLDHFFSDRTREKLLNSYMKGSLAGDLVEFTSSLKHDTFEDESIRGYYLFNTASRTVETYCMRNEQTDFALCPSSMTPYVETAAAKTGLAPMRDIAISCGSVFGILMVKAEQTHPTFKTVENSPAGALTEGAECSGVSNKEPHLLKIKKLRDAVEKNDPVLLQAMYPLTILKEDAAKRSTTRKRAIVETIDMKQSTMCIYLEFICRIMDARRVGGKRWFLNTIEFRRSLDAPGAQWPQQSGRKK
jgi:hypothetical protein